MTRKQIVIAALHQYLGDDAERYRREFAGYSEGALDSYYRRSGKTPRQILAEYEQHERAVKSAIEWAKNANIPD